MAVLPDLEAIIKEWEVDATIDSAKLDETTVRLARAHAKYLSYHSFYRLRLRKKEVQFDELRKDKWLYYTGKMTKAEMDQRGWAYDPFEGGAKPLRAELDYYFESDKDLTEGKSVIEYLKITIDAIKEILDTIRWRHSAVKNIIDAQKFSAGV
jgi:hypothetical protein